MHSLRPMILELIQAITTTCDWDHTFESDGILSMSSRMSPSMMARIAISAQFHRFKGLRPQDATFIRRRCKPKAKPGILQISQANNGKEWDKLPES